MPLMYSKIRYDFYLDKYSDVKLSYLDWYNSTFLIRGKSKTKVLDLASHILDVWKEYSDEEVDIRAYTDGVRHNTITPVVRKVDGEYYVYLILRNNRCNDVHPDGIFHAHQEYFNIKKEGIGLIEAMGLFILPARLKRQMGEVEYLLDNNVSLEEYFKDHEDMKVHEDMITYLRGQKGDSKVLIQNYINDVCRNILKCTAVFKDDELGQEHLRKFVKSL